MIVARHVLAGIVNNKSYAKKVVPFLKAEYFQTFEDTYVFKLMRKYMATYKAFPTLTSLKLELANVKDLSETGYKDVSELIDSVFSTPFDYTEEYLVKLTEKWIQDRALSNALLKSITLQEKGEGVEAIPDILRKALQISFQGSSSYEIFDDKSIDDRYQAYQKRIKKYSTGLQKLDELTDGGFETKSLSIFFGGSGVGKSASMVALGANMARNGENVLYITLEMSDAKISQRFEANFLDEYINNISKLEEEEYKTGLKKIKSDSLGRIVVKEYPPATITNLNIEALLDELEIKRNFHATVVIIDYLNLMRSSRVTNENSYTTVKCICEEVRGLAVARELCIISATQANKEGNSSKLTDMDATNVGESKGLMDTCDLLCAIIYNEELREQNIQIWKIVKNRFSGFVNNKFTIRVEHDKSKIYDSDDDMQMYGNRETSEQLAKEKKVTKKKKVEMVFKDKALDEDLFD